VSHTSYGSGLLVLFAAGLAWLIPVTPAWTQDDTGDAIVIDEPANETDVAALSADEDAEVEADEIDLGSVDVAGDRSLARLLGDDRAITVLSREVFGAARNLGEVLEEVPGADVRMQGGQGQLATLQLRGARAGQVLVLIDGAPLAPGGAADLSLLPLDTVERVEVLRGPDAARFGAGALGGVLNLITRRTPKQVETATPEQDEQPPLKERLAPQAGQPADDADVSASLQQSWGSFSAWASSIDYSNADARWYYRHSQAENDYSFSRADGSRAQRINNAARQDDLWTAWRAGSSNWHAGVTRQRRGVPGSAEFPTPLAQLGRDCGWLQGSGPDWRAALSVQSSHFTDPQPYLGQLPLDSRETYYHAESGFGAAANPLESYTLKPRLDYIRSTDYGAHFRAGLDAARFWERPLGGAQARLELGLSASSDVGVDPQARAALSWDVADGGQAYCAAGYAVRHPEFGELYLAGMGSLEGNPDLRPERAWNLELGGGWSGARAQLTAAVFATWYEDSILFVPVSAYLVRASNTGQARVAGAELYLDQQLSPRLWWRSAYSYLPVAEYASGIRLSGRARQHASTRLEYTGAAWRWGLGADYTSSMTGDLFGSLHIPGRTLLSADVSRSFGGAEVTLSAANLLNQAARDSWNYPLPGREFNLTFKVDL
jgi:vitamin B12 transporter